MAYIVKWKQWYQVKNSDGFTITQFLNKIDAEVFIGSSSNLPCADLKLGHQPIHQRKGYTVKKISVYP